jgi:purine-binding chemotaxis protein CheW
MNLADIRRKAQAADAQLTQAQAPVAQSTAAPATVQAPYVPPVATQAPEAQAAPESLADLEWEDPTDWESPAPAAQSVSVAPPASAAPLAPAAPSAPAAPAAPSAPAAPPDPPVSYQSQQSAPVPALWEESGVPATAWEEQAGFDPAALILRGRESASGQEIVHEADQAETTLELLCFRVATEDYAISIMDIKEIIKPREVTEVPRVPAFVRGILSLRGIIIPVFDMRLRLGLPEGVRSERERIVVVKRQGGFCGVLVDQVVQVVRIAETGVEAPPVVLEGIDREFVRGIGRVAGRMLILLDMEKVLDISLL